MKKGSVTIFTTLVLILVLSFVFSLLESARVSSILARTRRITDVCIQSMFGNFHTGLWEDYHLLFLDGSGQGNKLAMERFAQKAMEELEENVSYAQSYLGKPSWDLTAINPVNVEINHYQLATDDGGKAFQSQVSLQMQMEAAQDMLNELCLLQELGEEVREEKAGQDTKWEQAWEAKEKAKEQAEEQAKEQEQNQSQTTSREARIVGGKDLTEKPKEESTVEDPMDYVKDLKASSMLAVVLENPENLSGKSLTDSDYISKRQLETGNWSEKHNTDIMDRVYLQYYIQQYFSNYVEESEKGPEDRVLSYEMEYILSGKKSDSQNLEKVVYELLALREAMNFVTIMQDPEKKNMAMGIAAATVGFTGIVPLIKAVQIGILMAWAFVESVLDVRTLLEGGKVPFLKKTHQWSSDLENCRDTIESNARSGKKEGLTYSNYLQILLFLLSEETISYRCMDLMERNEDVKMDCMVQSLQGTFHYEAKPLFWNFNFLSSEKLNDFKFPVEMKMSYVTS